MSKRWRYLTELEIVAAQRIFSDGLDYGRIKIYRGIPYLPSMNVAIAPNGHIYFPRHNCPEDFVLAGASYQMWLIHELTHVWQHQQGFRPWLAGIYLLGVGGYFRRKAYVYPPLAQISCFSELNMEQQADVLAHYYAARYLPLNAYSVDQAEFQTALSEFLRNPKQKTLLPKYRYRG